MSRARARAEGSAASERGETQAGGEASRERAGKRTMGAALKMLASRPFSERLLRERLLAKPWADPDLVDQCMARLKEQGLINDSQYARNYASYRVSTKPVGRSRLARELAGKKVPRERIDEALDIVFDEVEEETLIERAIEKRIRTHGRPTDRNGEKRMFDHLARRGFDYDLIMRKLRSLRASVEDDE